VEQDLKLRLLRDKLNEGWYDHKKDIITLFLALQEQNFVLGNSLTNLVKKWPKPPLNPDPTTIKEVAAMFGILLETKD
jgi:hypothetical protein